MPISRRRLLTFAMAAPAVATFAPRAYAASPPIYAEGGVAVDGSDVVAYFDQGAPVAGDANITLDYMGATWRFTSAANRASFEANPMAYVPQYGGYCAYAASKGYTAPTVPEAWTIVDDKLYLNFSVEVRGLWAQDIPGNIAAADSNWPGILG